MGLTKIGFDTVDLVVRNLRLAGSQDLVRLGEQLARNEDKLERVLQEVERLQDQVRGRSSSRARRHQGQQQLGERQRRSQLVPSRASRGQVASSK